MGEWAGQNIRLLADTAKVVPTWKCELCVQGQLSSNFNLEDLRCRFLLYGRESSFQSKTAGLKPQIFSNPAAPQHPCSCFILNEALPFHAPTTTKRIRLSLDSAPALVNFSTDSIIKNPCLHGSFIQHSCFVYVQISENLCKTVLRHIVGKRTLL